MNKFFGITPKTSLRIKTGYRDEKGEWAGINNSMTGSYKKGLQAGEKYFEIFSSPAGVFTSRNVAQNACLKLVR